MFHLFFFSSFFFLTLRACVRVCVCARARVYVCVCVCVWARKLQLHANVDGKFWNFFPSVTVSVYVRVPALPLSHSSPNFYYYYSILWIDCPFVNRFWGCLPIRQWPCRSFPCLWELLVEKTIYVVAAGRVNETNWCTQSVRNLVTHTVHRANMLIAWVGAM